MVTFGNEATVSPFDAAADADRYYSVAEAAARLGVSRISVWRWIRDGRLPAARLGHRTTRISERDLYRLLAPSPVPPAFSVDRHVTLPAEQRIDHTLAPRAGWWEVNASEHLVQFYESDEFLIGAVCEFIGSSLRANDAAIVIATPAHRQAFEERMTAVGIAVRAAELSGQYVALDAAETLSKFMVGSTPDSQRFKAVVGGVVDDSLGRWPRLRAFGEMVALLAAAGQEGAAMRLEAFWNELQLERGFALM